MCRSGEMTPNDTQIILRQTQLFVGFGLFALFVMTDFNEVAGEQLFRRMAFFNIIKCRLFLSGFLGQV